MTDQKPTLADMIAAVRAHANWAGGNAQRCKERLDAGTMSVLATIDALESAKILRAAAERLEESERAERERDELRRQLVEAHKLRHEQLTEACLSTRRHRRA